MNLNDRMNYEALAELMADHGLDQLEKIFKVTGREDDKGKPLFEFTEAAVRKDPTLYGKLFPRSIH